MEVKERLPAALKGAGLDLSSWLPDRPDMDEFPEFWYFNDLPRGSINIG